jgi:hypothetical protein
MPGPFLEPGISFKVAPLCFINIAVLMPTPIGGLCIRFLCVSVFYTPLFLSTFKPTNQTLSFTAVLLKPSLDSLVGRVHFLVNSNFFCVVYTRHVKRSA